MVFICSPFRGDTEKNVKVAQEICRLCAKQGIFGFAPHLYFPQFLDDDVSEDRMFGIAKGLDMMQYCDEVWVFKNITEGMQQEIEYAMKINKPVRFYPDVESWKKEITKKKSEEVGFATKAAS